MSNSPAKCVQSLVIIITLNISSHAIKRVRIIAAAVYVYTLVVISYITRVYACECADLCVHLECGACTRNCKLLRCGRGRRRLRRCLCQVRIERAHAHRILCRACMFCMFCTMCQWPNSRKACTHDRWNGLGGANVRSLALLNRWWCTSHHLVSSQTTMSNFRTGYVMCIYLFFNNSWYSWCMLAWSFDVTLNAYILQIALHTLWRYLKAGILCFNISDSLKYSVSRSIKLSKLFNNMLGRYIRVCTSELWTFTSSRLITFSQYIIAMWASYATHTLSDIYMH